jgi:hypothetical protein
VGIQVLAPELGLLILVIEDPDAQVSKRVRDLFHVGAVLAGK